MRPDEGEDEDGGIPVGIPAAAPVARGRFVLDVSNRDHDSAGSHSSDDNDRDDAAFGDAEKAEERTLDADWERLLGPLPRRSSSGESADAFLNLNNLEVDTSGGPKSDTPDIRQRLKGKRKFCHCCPDFVRRGPWQVLTVMMGRDASGPSRRIGNMTVLCPPCFRSAGFGIVGPHWFGPLCCSGLLTIATIYFAPKAHHTIGPVSAIICLLFWLIGMVSLCIVSCSDPGVVRSGAGGYAGLAPSDVSAGRGWRYCDFCGLYQPPSAVHCPECNVCIEGYDHHCPWMGTCIGKKNYNSFLVFNATWLFYLLYSVIWVLFVGATFGQIAGDFSDDN